jgi:hypothetical protein
MAQENAPKPITGQNYSQWLNEQYGLKKLVEHIGIVIGVASTGHTMPELRQRMAERFAGVQTQMAVYSPLQH